LFFIETPHYAVCITEIYGIPKMNTNHLIILMRIRVEKVSPYFNKKEVIAITIPARIQALSAVNHLLQKILEFCLKII